MWHVAELVAEGRRRLPRRRGIPDPGREAVWLLASAWGVEEVWLRARPRAVVPREAAARYLRWVERRARGEPAHHLTGRCPFWGREFVVSPDVLVPRPETELLVDAALRLDLPTGARVVDIGTGSGCIAVTLALERPRWRVVATDVSPAALAVARRNAARLGAVVSLLCCDLASAVRGRYHLVTANLPYVPSASVGTLPAEVRHEPTVALNGGADGLAVVRKLLADLPRLVAPGGAVLMEVGEGQAGSVEVEARSRGLRPAGRIRDLGGCDRVVVLTGP